METELLDYLRSLRLRVGVMTYRRKEWQIRSFFKWLEKQGKQYSEVKQDDVTAFLSGLVCSRSVRQQMAQVIRDFYDFHKIEENPAAGILFKRDDSRKLPSVPGRSAVDAIITTLNSKDDILSVRDLLTVELAYGSGLRRAELRKVNIDDINFEEQTIRVTGKGSKTRIVPLTEEAIGIIRRYLAMRRGVSRGPLLVSFMGKRLSLQGVYTILKDRAGIRPHLLRHACATHMLANGAGIRVIQEMLGHADLKATQIYTAIEKGQLKEVINTRHPRRN
jgi:site-specific recombinase XerD